MTKEAIRGTRFEPAAEPVFLTVAELGARWRVSPAHLLNLRRSGEGPAWFEAGVGAGVRKGIRYPIAEVLAYETAQTSARPRADDCAPRKRAIGAEG